MKHVEAMEIYDASCQSVIMSDDSQGHHGKPFTVICIFFKQQQLCKINPNNKVFHGLDYYDYYNTQHCFL